jgi:hypothetical protein
VPGTVAGGELRNSVLAKAEQKNVTVRHIISNLVFSQPSENVVEVSWVMVAFRSETEILGSYPRFVADVQDCFKLYSGQWRLAIATPPSQTI